MKTMLNDREVEVANWFRDEGLVATDAYYMDRGEEYPALTDDELDALNDTPWWC